MAYYDSSYDYGYDHHHHHGYHQTHFDVVPFPSSQQLQNPICNATYGFNGSDFFNYGATNYCYNDAAITGSPMVGYSVVNFSEPRNLVYNPNSSMFSISQSVSSATFIEPEFNETEFEEFDSTPYGGGYDLDLQYGKPLLPSEKTCYPLPPPGDPSSPSLDNFSYSSIESPYGEEKEVQYYAGKPLNKAKPSSVSSEQQPPGNGGREPERKPADSGKGEDLHRNLGYGSELGNHEKVVGNHIPSGYGLEATDLCESLFGYWPCLERIKRRERSDRQQVESFGEEYMDGNPWEGTVEYIFGSLNPYGGRKEDEGIPMYFYQNHYQEHLLYLQQDQKIVEYREYQ